MPRCAATATALVDRAELRRLSQVRTLAGFAPDGNGRDQRRRCWRADVSGFTTASVVEPFGNLLGIMHNPHFFEVAAARAQAVSALVVSGVA